MTGVTSVFAKIFTNGGAIMATVFLLDKSGEPLMPCRNSGRIRILLKEKKAKVVRREPFMVQLLIEVRRKHKEPISLGVDAGYTYIGFSATTQKKELFSAELEQDCGMMERNKERRIYRRQRRNHKRYRKPRFNNRRKPEDWIAPSLERKRNTHLQFIQYLCSIMPITTIRVEIGLFDPALLKATAEGRTLEGTGYQHGEQEGFENVKAYVRYRDNYTCQNPDCPCHKMKLEDREKLKLFVHHLGYWKHDRSNRPSNLITLCELSHTPENHQPGHLLYGWEPKLKSFREVAFMNIVRKEVVEMLKIIYSDKEVRYTYGYKTNMTRNDWHVEKTHHDDAFCITQVHSQERADTVYYFKQHRRNNRSLEIFYDAKYIDARDGKKKSGKELFCGRTTRNKNNNTENLHKYRQQKVSKGRRSIRKQHYPYQPNDIVWFDNKKYRIKGTHCNGTRVILDNKKSVSTKKIQIAHYNAGIYIEKEMRQAIPLHDCAGSILA